MVDLATNLSGVVLPRFIHVFVRYQEPQNDSVVSVQEISAEWDVSLRA